MDVIQEDDNMGDHTIHSEDTVRQGNIPEVRKTELSLNIVAPQSDDRPDKVLFRAGENGLTRC